jgi:predicted GTPase
MSKNNTLNETGHVMVLGKTGAGKTPLCSRIFLAQSDVSQLKALYSGGEGERLAEAIRQNCSIVLQLNSRDGSGKG